MWTSRLVVLAAAALIAGCATFSLEEADKLQPGVSTIADAKAKLGPPNSESMAGDNGRLLQWISNRGFKGQHVAILFGADGRMVRMTHRYSSNP